MLQAYQVGSVIASGAGTDLRVEALYGGPYATLVTNVDIGRGSRPFGPLWNGQRPSSYMTYWNIRVRQGCTSRLGEHTLLMRCAAARASHLSVGHYNLCCQHAECKLPRRTLHNVQEPFTHTKSICLVHLQSRNGTVVPPRALHGPRFTLVGCPTSPAPTSNLQWWYETSPIGGMMYPFNLYQVRTAVTA